MSATKCAYIEYEFLMVMTCLM